MTETIAYCLAAFGAGGFIILLPYILFFKRWKKEFCECQEADRKEREAGKKALTVFIGEMEELLIEAMNLYECYPNAFRKPAEKFFAEYSKSIAAAREWAERKEE